MDLNESDLKAAAAFSRAAYDVGASVWGTLNILGQTTGPNGWIISGSSAWLSEYGAPLGGTHLSSGGTQILAGTDARGFFRNNDAAAIAAVKDGQLIIAFRGSDSMSDIADAISDPISHYNDLQPFIDDVMQFVRDPSHGISSVIVTGHSLGGELAQLFTTNYTDGAGLHSADVNLLGISASNVSIITFGNPGLPSDPSANFAVSGAWQPRITNFGNTDDSGFNHWDAELWGDRLRAGQDLLFDLNTISATSGPPNDWTPGPDVAPFTTDYRNGRAGTTEHGMMNYLAAIDTIASSAGFSWINTNDISLFGFGDHHDNDPVIASGASRSRPLRTWACGK